ncbi:PAS domain-containing sensor histidine kinase [Parvularcula dongshanensis]|uniref:histidine kinase n=1 Tax=Parvularcula dongshanensis TaxID=1173995 RepID=A0A840I062_9PROT|nr:PAS domain-containing protein [Parvularcula dongshanensis]MBB4657602.1 PAS domain S-box-containing protein [Parvularcula dongshanensis]
MSIEGVPTIEPLAHAFDELPLRPSALFDRAPAIISVHQGPEHVYLYMNARTELVADGRDLLGRPLIEAVPEFKGQGIVERFDLAFRTGKNQRAAEIEVRLPARDGALRRRRWYNHTVEPWHDGDGRVAGVMSFAFDVTEQVRSRRAAQASEARLTRFLDAMNTYAARLALDGTLLGVNASALSLGGVAADDVIGLPFWETYWWSHDEGTRQRLRTAIEAAARGGTVRYDETVRTRDDDRIVVDVTLAPERDEHDRLIAIVASGTDVTERVRAERALAESEARFRVITDAMPQLVWGANADGVIDYSNEQMRLFAGLQKVGQRSFLWTELLHKDDREGAADSWAAAQAAAAPFETEFRLLHHTGEYRWVLARALPLLDGGEVVRWFGTCTDINRIKTTETHRRLLTDELNHRVKNTLAVVQSVAYQTFSDTDAEALAAFDGRLAALATAHDLLTREAWEKAELSDVVRTGLRACGVSEDRYTVSGPAIVLPAKLAVTMAMAVHELATNALKYGALSVDEGVIDVRWREGVGPAGPRLSFLWTERGGPQVVPPDQRGFGSRLIETALANELRGSAHLDFRPSGLVCTIDAPAPQVRRPPRPIR